MTVREALDAVRAAAMWLGVAYFDRRRLAWTTDRHSFLVEGCGTGYVWAVGERVDEHTIPPLLACGWEQTRRRAKAAAERAAEVAS